MKKNNIKKTIVTLFIIIVSIVVFINIRGNYIEYYELGQKYIQEYEIDLKYHVLTVGINFVILYSIIYISTRGIKKGLKVFFDEEKLAMPKLPNKSISLIASVIVSIIIGIIFTPKIILCASNSLFEQTDGIFNIDISFYVFIEPLIKMFIIYFIGILIGLIFYSTIYYILVFNKFFDGINKETLKKSYLIKHIIRYIRIMAIFIAIYILVGTLDIVFDSFITTNSGLELIGAGTIACKIKIWQNIILAIIFVISIFLATINFKKENKQKLIKSIFIVPVYMVIMFIITVGFDMMFVRSNEYDKEKQYIEKNISYTKNAYGINCNDQVIEYSGTITVDEVEENSNIINNAVIVSKELALESLNEDQTEKGYYTYKTAGITKYVQDGIEKLVYLSPREMVNNKRTFNSKTFEYTHGYGAVITSATETTKEGGVEYIRSKIEDNGDIKTPQIYYGMETNDTIVINNKIQNEYDYTNTKGEEFTSSYIGESGINLNWFDRLILGIKTGNISLALSRNITSDSKILLNRNIVQRAKKVLSNTNIIYDQSPYAVIDENGDIYWVLDTYTISNHYPYSTNINIQNGNERQKINYIRNSIKVIVNAYDGSMKFYITDTSDPIVMAYRNIYPNIFESLDSSIPKSISDKFIYPEFLYNIQASMLEEYHNTKSEVLYRGDDSWAKTTYVTTQSNKTVNNTLDSYYTMVMNNNDEAIGLVQMYNLKGKQNITSYLVGVVDNGVNKLKISKLSSDTGLLGITQLCNQIELDENIKQEIENLNVIGAKVTKNMMVIPINNTLLYIEQVYQTKTNESNIPLLKKVIVASGNKLAIGDNINDAIKNLVSQYATSIDIYSSEDIDGLIQSLIKANNNLSNSMKSNDWELIGTDVKKLQELISALEKQSEKEKNQIINNETVNE